VDTGFDEAVGAQGGNAGRFDGFKFARKQIQIGRVRTVDAKIVDIKGGRAGEFKHHRVGAGSALNHGGREMCDIFFPAFADIEDSRFDFLRCSVVKAGQPELNCAAPFLTQPDLDCIGLFFQHVIPELTCAAVIIDSQRFLGARCELQLQTGFTGFLNRCIGCVWYECPYLAGDFVGEDV
jgi:hypothetical protein